MQVVMQSTTLWASYTKHKKLILCIIGDGSLLAPATAKLFFDHVIYSYGVT